MPQGAFEDLLASSPRIQGCDDWDVETFWTEIGEADRRMQPLLWLQRSTRQSQGEHLIFTFSKATPARASRTRKRTARAAGMLAEQHQQALRSNRPVRANTSFASSSGGQAAYRFTTSMKDVWDYVKSGIGNVVGNRELRRRWREERKSSWILWRISPPSMSPLGR